MLPAYLVECHFAVLERDSTLHELTVAFECLSVC